MSGYATNREVRISLSPLSKWIGNGLGYLFARNREPRPGNPPGSGRGLLAQDQVQLSGVMLGVPHIVEEQFGDAQASHAKPQRSRAPAPSINDHSASLPPTMH